MKRLSIIILLTLAACVSTQQEKYTTVEDKTAAMAIHNACNGPNLNMPDPSFEPKGRSRNAILGYINCLAKAVPDEKEEFQKHAFLWKNVFDKKITSSQASVIWAEHSKPKPQEDDIFTAYMKYRMGHPSSSYSDGQQWMNQQRILQNQQQQNFQLQQIQQQQFMNNGGYGG